MADVREVVGAPEAPLVARLDARRGEPVGALPAVALAPHRAPGAQLVVHRARLGGTPVGALLVGEVHGEDVAVGLLVLLHHVALGGVGAVAARVDRQHVDPGLTLGDPLGELPARAAGGGDPEAVALVQPHVLHPPGGADQRAAVGRIGDRAVDDVLDAAVLERRHAARRGLHVRHQPVEVARKQAAAEPVRHAVGETRRGTLLVGTQDPAHALLAQVIGLIGFAQHRQLAAAVLAILLQLGGFVVDDVLVLDRDRRHVEPEQAAGLAGVVAGGEHQMLGADLALGGAHQPLPGRRARDRLRFGVLVDLGTGAAGALAQRHGEIGGCDVTVIGVVERADDRRRVGAAAELDQGPQLLHALAA